MRYLFTLILFLIAVHSYGQNRINGYLIDNDGKKQEIFLSFKQEILTSSNTVFYYDAISSGDKRTALATEVSEIGYADKSVIIKSSRINEIDATKNVFIRQLSEGSFELYKYSSDKRTYFVIKNNGVTTILTKSADEKTNLKSYKEVLYTNFNPQKLPVKDYVNLSFKEQALISYFKTNYPTSNMTLLPQEYKVSSFNFAILAGYVTGTSDPNIIGNNGEIQDSSIPLGGFHAGVRVEKNIDRISNKLTAYASLQYFSMNGTADYAFNEQSNFQRIDTSVETDISYVSVAFGIKYNVHVSENLTLSPFLGFEVNRGMSGNNVVYTRKDNNQILLQSSEFIESLDALQIGFELTIKKHFLIGAGYSTFINNGVPIIYEESFPILVSSSRLSLNSVNLSIGYRF